MNDADAFAPWLRGVAPYLHEHRGKTFAIHAGGDTLQGERLATLMHDLALLASLDIRIVLSFGIRPQVEALLRVRGIEARYCRGLRVTGREALECVKQAAGTLRAEIEALLSMGLPNIPMAGASLRVASGNLVGAYPAGVLDGIDVQYTGRVRRIDAKAIRARLAEGCIVLLPPLGYSITGELFNVNAGEIACRAACALRADKLLYLVSSGLTRECLDGKGLPEGQRAKREEIVSELSLAEARHCLRMHAERCRAEGAAEIVGARPHDSLLKRVEWCVEAADNGVRRCHLIGQERDGALLLELFSRDGVSTMLSAESFDALRKARPEDVNGIEELIRPLERNGQLAPRSRARLERDLDRFTVIVRDGTVIACGALHPYREEETAEIECLAVHPNYRGQARGRALYESLEREARRHRAQRLFVLTTQAAHWFLERGFAEAGPRQLPPSRRDSSPSRNSKTLVKEL